MGTFHEHKGFGHSHSTEPLYDHGMEHAHVTEEEALRYAARILRDMGGSQEYAVADVLENIVKGRYGR